MRRADNREVDPERASADEIAHDLTNVLVVILTYTELIAARVDDEDVRRDLAEVTEAARRAAELTQRLLEVARREG